MVGVLLANLGTPASPRVRDVRRYLREFLMDPRVLDMSPIARALLVYGIILPFRPRRSAAAYAQIWSEAGSPLLANGRALERELAAELGPGHRVELGMRYGRPSIGEAVERLAGAGVERIAVLPLFPQYAASSTGSALERAYREAGARWNVPPLDVVPPFYAHPGFIEAQAALARSELAQFRADHVLLSYHGLPERQVRRSDPTGTHCLAGASCCDAIGDANRDCYRAHCFATSRALAAALDLEPGAHSTSFQSRLGRTPWIRPYTDRVLPELRQRGVSRLAVLCPSFVADCLETLEEIGIRARAQWRDLGGDALLPVPCVNAHPLWVKAAASMIHATRAAGM